MLVARSRIYQKAHLYLDSLTPNNKSWQTHFSKESQISVCKRASCHEEYSCLQSLVNHYLPYKEANAPISCDYSNLYPIKLQEAHLQTNAQGAYVCVVLSHVHEEQRKYLFINA